MQQRAIRRLTGLSGIFALGCILISYILILSAGVNLQTLMQHFPDVIFPGFAQQLGRPVIFALWGLIFSDLFLLGFGVGIEHLYSSRHWLIPFATRMLISAMIILMIVSLFSIGILKGLAPVISDADATTDSLKGTAQTFIAFRNYAALFSGFLVAIAGIGFGLGALNRTRVPGYWVIAAGIMGIAGAFWPIAVWLGYLRNFGYLMFLIWVCYTGTGLLQENMETDTALNSLSGE